MIGPVEVLLARDHQFALKPGTKHRCVCNRPRLAPEHGPFSWNQMGSMARTSFTYQSIKRSWEHAMRVALTAAGMPVCDRVTVEGLICFPTRTARDEDNFRYPLSKYLGDALQAGGWLESDRWESFRFGALEATHKPGESWVKLMLFPAVNNARKAA